MTDTACPATGHVYKAGYGGPVFRVAFDTMDGWIEPTPALPRILIGGRGGVESAR